MRARLSGGRNSYEDRKLVFRVADRTIPLQDIEDGTRTGFSTMRQIKTNSIRWRMLFRIGY